MRPLQPVAQHVGLARLRKRLQPDEARWLAQLGEVERSELVEQRLRLCGMAGAARERPTELIEGLVERGQQHRADAVACEAGVGVARVVDPGQRTFGQPAANVGSVDRQQGPMQRHPAAQRLRRHGRQARQARAARQREQHRLDLVVRVMPDGDRLHGRLGRDHPGQRQQRRVARVARGGLRAFSGRMRCIDAMALQRHVDLLTDRSAMPLEIIRCGLQAVMHMKSADLARPARGACDEQCGRIGASAESNGQRQGGLEGRDGLLEWHEMRHGAAPLPGYLPLSALVSEKRP